MTSAINTGLTPSGAQPHTYGDSDVPTLCLKTTTWSRDSHELFDYEASHGQVQKKTFYLKKQGKVFRVLLDVQVVADGGANPPQADYLLSIRMKDGHFVVIPAERILPSLIPKKLWLIVKHLPGASHPLQENDVVKLGRFKLRVKQLTKTGDPNQPQELKLEEGETVPNLRVTDEEAATVQCRICLLEGGNHDDPVICPCQCNGSIKYVHLECLRHWINARLGLSEDVQKSSYFIRQILCELCKTPFPSLVYVNERRIPIVKLPHIQPPFIILENLVGNANRGLHIISMAEKKDLKLGRGHESDVRIADVSISRYHATIRFLSGNFILEDHGSKFGTLVSLRKYQPIEQNQTLALQVGRTVVTVSLDFRPSSHGDVVIVDEGKPSGVPLSNSLPPPPMSDVSPLAGSGPSDVGSIVMSQVDNRQREVYGDRMMDREQRIGGVFEGGREPLDEQNGFGYCLNYNNSRLGGNDALNDPITFISDLMVNGNTSSRPLLNREFEYRSNLGNNINNNNNNNFNGREADISSRGLEDAGGLDDLIIRGVGGVSERGSLSNWISSISPSHSYGTSPNSLLGWASQNVAPTTQLSPVSSQLPPPLLSAPVNNNSQHPHLFTATSTSPLYGGGGKEYLNTGEGRQRRDERGWNSRLKNCMINNVDEMIFPTPLSPSSSPAPLQSSAASSDCISNDNRRESKNIINYNNNNLQSQNSSRVVEQPIPSSVYPISNTFSTPACQSLTSSLLHDSSCSTMPSASVPNPYASVPNPYASVPNPYASVPNPSASVPNPSASISAACYPSFSPTPTSCSTPSLPNTNPTSFLSQPFLSQTSSSQIPSIKQQSSISQPSLMNNSNNINNKNINQLPSCSFDNEVNNMDETCYNVKGHINNSSDVLEKQQQRLAIYPLTTTNNNINNDLSVGSPNSFFNNNSNFSRFLPGGGSHMNNNIALNNNSSSIVSDCSPSRSFPTCSPLDSYIYI